MSSSGRSLRTLHAFSARVLANLYILANYPAFFFTSVSMATSRCRSKCLLRVLTDIAVAAVYGDATIENDRSQVMTTCRQLGKFCLMTSVVLRNVSICEERNVSEV